MFACLYLISLVYLVPVFEKNVIYYLVSESVLAFISIGLINRMEICIQTNLAGIHLCDDRADSSVYADIYRERSFSWSDTEFEELSAILGLFPGLLLFVSHRLIDSGFRSCYQGLECLRFWL